MRRKDLKIGKLDLVPDSPELVRMVQHIPCEPDCAGGCEVAADHPDFQDGGIDL